MDLYEILVVQFDVLGHLFVGDGGQLIDPHCNQPDNKPGGPDTTHDKKAFGVSRKVCLMKDGLQSLLAFCCVRFLLAFSC